MTRKETRSVTVTTSFQNYIVVTLTEFKDIFLKLELIQVKFISLLDIIPGVLVYVMQSYTYIRPK